MKKSIPVLVVLAAAMLTAVFATTQMVYAQIESNEDSQDSSGDDTITEENTFNNEPNQEANEECNGEGATCTESQGSESNGGGPVTHGPINTSRSNIKSL